MQYMLLYVMMLHIRFKKTFLDWFSCNCFWKVSMEGLLDNFFDLLFCVAIRGLMLGNLANWDKKLANLSECAR